MNYFALPILFFVLVCNIAFTQESLIQRYYETSYGTLPNLESGATSVLGLSALAFDQTNYLIENKVENKLLNIASRIANFTFLQLYLGGLFYGTFLHEQFGHHARASEFGLPLELQYNFPGLGGDFLFPVDYKVPAIKRQIVVAAGFEATSLLSFKALQGLYGRDYSGSYVGLYLLSGKLIEGILTIQNDIQPFLEDANAYYARNKRLMQNPVPNDPLAYLLALTENYGFYDDFIDRESTWVQRLEDMTLYTQNDFIVDQNRRMKTAFLLTALDPALLYFLYGSYKYLVKGDLFIKPFMFRIKGVSFMPSIRANYGELGAENYFDLFFKPNDAPPFNIYYRRGGNLFDKISGFGFEIRKVEYKQFVFEGQLDYWRNGRERTDNFNLYLKGNYAIIPEKLLLTAGIGYKSKGGLMGKPYRKGLYAYFGLGWNLKYKLQD